MLVFCDTSALYAVANRDDESHVAASRIWTRLVEEEQLRAITTNYVVVETFSLAQRRRGLRAARAIAEALHDCIEVAFVDEDLHRAAIDECLQRRRRTVSLVDYVSFAFMRRLGIQVAFAFDRHFAEQGFHPASQLA